MEQTVWIKHPSKLYIMPPYSTPVERIKTANCAAKMKSPSMFFSTKLEKKQ